MRKDVIIIRCDGDGCDVVAEIDDKSLMPEGWYHMKMPDADGKIYPHVGFDLCSLSCVSKWAHGRAAALGEPLSNGKHGGGVAPGHRYKKIPCPVCEKPCAPQGFRQHALTQHPDEDWMTMMRLYNEARRELVAAE